MTTTVKVYFPQGPTIMPKIIRVKKKKNNQVNQEMLKIKLNKKVCKNKSNKANNSKLINYRIINKRHKNLIKKDYKSKR